MSVKPNVGLQLPESCISCGLYRNCKTYKIPPTIDKRNNPAIDKDTTILVVTQHPHSEDDRVGQPLYGAAGDFLKEYLNELECNWVLVNGVRCCPGACDGGYDGKPSKKQQDDCVEHLMEVIDRYRPAVIVCLGKMAMTQVLGKDAPKSLRSATPRQLSDGTWVMTVEHPLNHTSGRTDLSEKYLALFEQAERLALGIEDDVEFKYRLVRTLNGAYESAPKWKNTVYLDVETGQSNDDVRKLTHWHPDAVLVSISVTFATSPGKYYTIVYMEEALNKEFWQTMLAEKVIWAHNTKFDMSVMWHHLGFNPYEYAKEWHDTFGHYYLRDQSKPGNSLKNLAQIHLNALPWADEVWLEVDKINKRTQQENKLANKEGLPLNDYIADFRDVEPQLLAKYNAMDTFYTARLAEECIPEFTEGLKAPIAYTLFCKATYALNRVEQRGLPVNEPRLRRLKVAVDNKVEELQTLLQTQPEIVDVERGFRKQNWSFLEPDVPADDGWYEWLPVPLNVKSFKFMERLAERLESHTGDRTEKTGRLKFNTDNLKYLSGIHPAISEKERTRANWLYYYIYHIRQNRDLSSKFLTNLLNYTVRGRIHTSYRLGRVDVVGRTSGGDMEGGATTGRLSSSNPNLQNIKKDNVLRSCFQAEAGWWLAEADYDRIELVVLAALSGDCELTKDVAPGGDPHTAMGELIAKKLRVDFTEDIRDLAKRVNFGKIYGQTPQALSDMTGLSYPDACAIHRLFDEKYSGVSQYFATLRMMIDDGEMIVTPFGRKRSFNITGNPGMDGHSYRQACNFPIQSVASDITLWKLSDVYDYWDGLTAAGADVGFHPFNIVHDSHWHEIRKDLFTDIQEDLTNIMQDMSTLPIEFNLPLEVSWKIGENLGAMEKL